MHLSETEQAREHARIVGRLLGGRSPKSHPAARPLGYRTRARVHVDARKRGRVAVGMFARRSHEPAVVDTCVVLDAVLDRARGELATWLEGARGRGEAHLALGRPEEPRKAVLDLRWSGDLPGAVFGRLERAIADGQLAGARVFLGDTRVPAKIGDATPYIAGADGKPLRLAPGGFSQATEDGNVALAERVAELARGLAPGPCVELYAGAGNLTILLARIARSSPWSRMRMRAPLHARIWPHAASRMRASSKRMRAHTLSRSRRVSSFSIRLAKARVRWPRPWRRERRHDLAALRRSFTWLRPADARSRRPNARRCRLRRAIARTFEMFPNTSHVETVVVLVYGGSGA